MSSVKRLNQVIAVEKGIKQKTNQLLSDHYKAVQHPALFEGVSRKYQPKEEGGEQFPPEAKRVQFKAIESVRTAHQYLKELFDITLIKDRANCLAKADIVVDGIKIMEEVPATYLLFLQKNLTDLHTFVSKLPVLDSAEEWQFDNQQQIYRTEPTATVRTKKVQKALVLYHATDKHPAQTQLIVEDEIIGHWLQTKFSGAFAVKDKQKLLDRIEKLQKAVKFAREEANNTSVAEADTSPLFDWLLKD